MLLQIAVLLICTNSIIAFQICRKDDSIDISSGVSMINGSVDFMGVRYDMGDYYEDDEGSKRACVSSRPITLRKCCPYGEIYVPGDPSICVNYSEVDQVTWKVLEHGNNSRVFRFLIGKMTCKENDFRIKMSNFGDPDFHIQKDGRLVIGPIGSWSPDQYCIDTFLHEVDGEKKPRLDALLCYADTSNDDNSSYIITSSCMLISCVFILATVAVYMWLPELRNLHGRVLMVYLLCMFVGFLFMATMQILLLLGTITTFQCIGMTFVIYFFLQSAFFWLNVMSFDIWWTFSGKRGIRQSMSLQARFWAYSAYAFGIPTLLTTVMAGLEFSGLPSHPLLPNIKHLGCFLHGTSRLLYFYGPIVVVCIANTAFFMLTAIKIARIKKQTAMLNTRESSTHDPHRNDKQRLFLYVKLFLVMGVNWLLEVISAIYPEANYIWKFTDAYNVLTGLIIFIIFVCKKKIYRLIKKRFKQLRGDPMARNPTVTSRSASSRDDVRMNSIYDSKNPTSEKPPK